MFELPADDPTDPLKLADWLEIYALLSHDHNSSRGDLESALRIAALDELDSDKAIELKTLDVFEELEQRVRAAGEAYPFDLNYRNYRGVLELKSSWEDFPAYTFCLCLSYFGSQDNKPRSLFEQVSCLAARRYLQGSVVGFGAPRRELPSSFRDAISEMCKLIGEGAGYRSQQSLRRQDDTLDLVAWRDFNDRRPSKILMFGQCASGWNWETKLGDLDPRRFWDQWIQISLVSPPPIKSFFTPHRVERNKWEFIARQAGILFDRCRIAFWAHQEKANYDPHITWIKGLFTKVGS